MATNDASRATFPVTARIELLRVSRFAKWIKGAMVPDGDFKFAFLPKMQRSRTVVKNRMYALGSTSGIWASSIISHPRLSFEVETESEIGVVVNIWIP